MALAGVKEKYYKAGDLDDFQEGSKEKEYTTPEDMVEDYSEKDTDKGTNSHKSDDSGFMSEEDEFDFEYTGVDWVAEDDVWEDDDLEDYSEKDTDKGTNSHKSDDSGFMSEEDEFDFGNEDVDEDIWDSDEEEIYEEEDTDDSFGVAEETDEEYDWFGDCDEDYSYKSDDSGFMSEEDDLFSDCDEDYSDEEEEKESDIFSVGLEDDLFGDFDLSGLKSEENNLFGGWSGLKSEEDDWDDGFGDWDSINSGFESEAECGWRRRFKDLNTSNKENTDRICTTLKECFTELAIVGIIMTMFALLINIVMKDDK